MDVLFLPLFLEVILTAQGPHTDAVARADTSLMAAVFERDASRAWRDLASHFASVEMRGETISEALGENHGKRKHRTAWVFKRKGRMRLVETKVFDSSGKVESCRVFCWNAHYGFKLTSHSGKNGEWLIADADKRDDRRAIMAGAAVSANIPEIGWRILGGAISLPDMLLSDGFRLVGVTAFHGDSKPGVVKVQFEYAPGKALPGVDVLKGFMTLDSDDYWKVLSYDLAGRVPGPGGKMALVSAHGKTRYSATGVKGREVPVPQATVFEREIKSMHTGDRTTVVVHDVLFRNIPDSEFTLSAYQLPDFQALVTRRRSWSIVRIIALVATACAIVALILARTRRQAGAH